MNITVNSQLLAQEIRILSKVSNPKSTIQILSHVLLKAEDQLSLTATDLEVGIQTGCQATVGEQGQFTLPTKPLLDLLERLPNADVTFDEKGNIASGGFRSRLSSLPPADFPPLPLPNGEEPAILSASALRSLVERSRYAISEKEQKFVLKGALLTLTGTVAAMVATDGKRLSIVTANRQAGPDTAVIVPMKTLDAILDQTPSGEVAFSKSDRHLFFNYGKRMLVSRLIDGEFPKYQRIIPKANNNVATVDRGALIAAIRRVGLVAEVLNMRFSNGAIDLSSRSMEIGNADETLAAKYEGEEISVNLNWKFLLDFLEHANEPTVTIAAKDNKTPLLLTDGADFINVLMVIR